MSDCQCINWDQIAKVVQLCANVKAREISGTSRENGYYAAGHEGFTSKPALSGICDSAAAPFSCSCLLPSRPDLPSRRNKIDQRAVPGCKNLS